MPVYTYQCASCGHEFDFFQHYTDDSLTVCPECGKQSLQKRYRPIPVHFKGKGFYQTDKYDPAKAG